MDVLPALAGNLRNGFHGSLECRHTVIMGANALYGELVLMCVETGQHTAVAWGHLTAEGINFVLTGFEDVFDNRTLRERHACLSNDRNGHEKPKDNLHFQSSSE